MARFRTQRGFSLLEVLVAMAITIGVILATTSAVLNSLHATNMSDAHMALNDDALSAINDVRAISAYDSDMFKSLRGRSSSMTRTDAAGNIETIAVAVTPAGGNNLLATATVSEGGVTVTQQQTLFEEAPVPGSSVTAAPTPSPTPKP